MLIHRRALPIIDAFKAAFAALSIAVMKTVASFAPRPSHDGLQSRSNSAKTIYDYGHAAALVAFVGVSRMIWISTH